jgi:hypothetical protein
MRTWIASSTSDCAPALLSSARLRERTAHQRGAAKRAIAAEQIAAAASKRDRAPDSLIIFVQHQLLKYLLIAVLNGGHELDCIPARLRRSFDWPQMYSRRPGLRRLGMDGRGRVDRALYGDGRLLDRQLPLIARLSMC